MHVRSWIIVAAGLAAGPALADPPGLAFRTAGDGYYQFDTGVVRGKLRLDGKSQALSSVVHIASQIDMAKPPGIFSYYRVFSADTRYGHAARDWPTTSKLLPDGAVEVCFPPAKNHPLEITAVYRWVNAETLDLHTTVKPREAMPGFEVFLSSYFATDMVASVYVRQNYHARGQPRMLATDVNPLVDGTYLMFPRDRASARRIFDRRWEHPPNPVQWSVTRILAAPLALRRSEQTGLTAVIMAPPDDCFAVATPYNRTPPDGVAAHSSLYLSLFGQDLEAGQTARARSRVVFGRNVSDRQAIALYEKYLQEQNP